MRVGMFGAVVLLGAIVVGSTFVTRAISQTPAKAGYGVETAGLVAGKDFVESQVIVGLHQWGKEQEPPKLSISQGAQVVGVIHGTAVLLQFDSEQAASKAIPALLGNSNVSFVERNGFLSIPPMPTAPTKNGQSLQVPDPLTRGKGGSQGSVVEPELISADPATGHQWHHTVIRKTASLGALNPAPPTIAVIDTGVDYTHSDLAGKVILGQNCIGANMDPFDDHGHGTHVAGLAAAHAANGRYGEGVSHLSKIVAIKVLDWSGSGTYFQVACGMHYGHSVVTTPPTRVGNMSIGGGASALIAGEVDHWKAAGKLLVVAAGNENNTGTGTFNIDPDIGLRVQATEENDCRTYFSNFSPVGNIAQFNIAAPGWDIPSTLPDERYEAWAGTSMASPIVAGGAALVWGQFPALTRDQLIARMVGNGKSISCGFGAATRRLDVRRAIFLTGETAVIGRVLDGGTGKPPSPNIVAGTVQVRSGSTVLSSDATNRGGSYEVFGATLPGAGRNLNAIKGGYATNIIKSPVTVLAGVNTGPFTDAVHKSRPAGYFHGTVDWKTTQPFTNAAAANTVGWELDLGLRLPSGAVWVFGPVGDLSAAPWLQLERDSYQDLEPVEGFVIHPSAANGVYKIFVHRFSGPTLNLDQSLVQAQLFNASTPNLFLNAPTCTPAQPYWHIANVTKSGATYTVTTKNHCEAGIPAD